MDFIGTKTGTGTHFRIGIPLKPKVEDKQEMKSGLPDEFETAFKSVEASCIEQKVSQNGRIGSIAADRRGSEAQADDFEREKETSQLTDELTDEVWDGSIADASTAIDISLDWDDILTPSYDKEHKGEVESVADALIMSLSERARVDIEYIASLTGKSMKSVILELEGSIYQNPDTWEECYYKGWETAEEYLSGNLRIKWERALEANRIYGNRFDANLNAIKELVPDAVATEQIYVTIGSPWVPTEIIDEFIDHLLKLRGRCMCRTSHEEMTGSWEISNKSIYHYSVASTSAYGTSRISALDIIERTLNMKEVTVTDEVSYVSNGTPKKKRVINREETVLALEKQGRIVDEFKRWVWKDKERKERLERIFNEKYGYVRRRVFDGSFLKFPGMAKGMNLFKYQKDAVARIIFSPNTLLAHDVGSGKTYVMIAAGMELKRMGLSRKNMYVVPNNIVGQWRRIFNTLYPEAKVLSVDPKSFTPSKRKDTLVKLRDGEFDAIIIAYSCFDRLPLSKKYYLKRIQEELHELDLALTNKKKATASLKKRKEKLQKEYVKAFDEQYLTDGLICFDELGVTRIFVDEAHNYKNVPIDTKADKVLGISSNGSKKCREMLDKVNWLQKNNNGGGVVMATGTPITNSITDAFIMQKYLQSGELALLDLQSFDSWVGMFAERVTEFEIDVDTSGYRMATRFSRFHNLPELTALLSSIADFHQMIGGAGIPKVDGRKDALVGKTSSFAKYLQSITDRAELVRNGYVNRREDNMLKITTDGRKAALDLRLVDNKAPFTFQSKVARCAENVLDIYVRTARTNGTQLVFCDTSTPKVGFNLYDELKRLLTTYGVPAEKIAYVHDAETDTARERLFAKVRSGEIRVLIGSTFKLGIGVNVQNKLVALHHLDVPWRPADMTQREGRILRQGNENENVVIYRYVTEGSFDAYSWQLLETKQRFIGELLAGSVSERSGADIEGTVLDYAEVKALAVGNPLVKERVEASNALSRYLALQRGLIEQRMRLEQELSNIPARLEKQRIAIERCALDAEWYEENSITLDKEEKKALREEIFKAVSENVMQDEERGYMTYQGFDVILPENMPETKPFVYLQRNGRYYVELGESDLGTLVRIDNCLDKLRERHGKMIESRDAIILRREAITEELAKGEDYTDKINATREKIARIDKKLGVKKK